MTSNSCIITHFRAKFSYKVASAESLPPRADAAIRQMTFHATKSSNLPTRVTVTRRLNSALDFSIGKKRENLIKV